MKAMRKLFATIVLLFIAGIATAQDVIVKKDQTTVLSKVLEITGTEIKYKKWSNQDGPTYSINRSEVVSINYENGDVENLSISSQSNTDQQSVQKPKGGYMEFLSNRLKLNGKILSDAEVKDLVDEQSYQIYLKGKKDSLYEDLCLVGGGLAFSGACISVIYDNFTLAKVLGVVCGVGVAGWLCFTGRDEMEQVATEYNYRQGNHYSFNISPSLLNCETPQLQNNTCLGLTICLNF